MNLEALDKYGLTWHQKVAYIGTRMLDVEQAPSPVRHIFEPGWYIREISIPAGVVFIGRPHRFGHRIHMLKGRVRKVEPNGYQLIEPPFEFTTQPGEIMVLETFEDHVGRTYHPNPDECRDTELMEQVIFHPAEEMKLVGEAVAKRILELT